MANISLPFSLVKPDENTPVTTATEIYDNELQKSQAELNQLIGQGGSGEQDIAFADMVASGLVNVINLQGGVPAVRTGRTKTAGIMTFYEWKVVTVEGASFVYTRSMYPIAGEEYLQDIEVMPMSDFDIIEKAYTLSLSTIFDTLNEIKDMLTLADGEVTAELQTLIPNEEETV